MRLHRFYVADKIEGGKLGAETEFSIASLELVNQIRKVFRLKNGDSVILFDGSGFDFECEVVSSDKRSIDFHVVSTSRSHYMPNRDIYLCAAITKKDTFEWIVQKATELGVTHIVPVLAERSEKKSLNIERLEKIAVEASEQSGRGNVPKILSITDLAGSIGLVKSFKSVVFHIEADKFDSEEVFGGYDSGPLAVFIGPEGGWSPDEIDMFHSSKIDVRSLGDQVLRAETAVISALSLIVFSNK